MKVLHVSTYHQFCGIGNYAKSLVKGLQSHGVDNDVFAIDVDLLRTMDAQQAKAYFADVLTMAKGCDVVHIQHEYAFFHGDYSRRHDMAVLGSLLAGLDAMAKPTFITFHSPVFFAKNWWKQWSRLRINLAWRKQVTGRCKPSSNIRALAHNRFTCQEHIQSGAAANCMTTIPHVLETEIMTHPIRPELVEATKTALHLAEGDKVIGMIGFINSVKGHPFAVSCLAKMPAHVKLLVIGGTPKGGNPKLQNELQDTINAHGLQDRVHITGMFDEADLTSYMSVVDCFAAPYSHKFRSSSGAIHLALQSGKPVVASNAPAFFELNASQEPCPLAMFTDGSQMGFINQVQRVFEDDAFRQERLDATQAYLAKHTPEAVGAYHLALYRGEAPAGDGFMAPAVLGKKGVASASVPAPAMVGA